MAIVRRRSISFMAAAAAAMILNAPWTAARADQGGQTRDGAEARRRLVFVHPPADLNQIGALIPRGNVNAVAGGHVRPVNHMYVEYLVPRDGGTASLDVKAMAPGKIVAVFHRKSEACVVPDHTAPSDCATGPGATAMIDEYQVYTRHTDQLTSDFDHLHELDGGLGLPDWRDDTAGWLRVGQTDILVLGANGAVAPIRVHPGQRVGATRNYFTTWDIGVIDTRRRGNFLGVGALRYPTIPQFFTALIASGVPAGPLGPDQPFAGEMFVNSACFTDYLTPALAAAWRAKLAGGGSCGRPDWDVPGTLRGNWYRADVVDPTFGNMAAIEENAVSLSPYNLDPANEAKLGFGANFLAMAPAAVPPTLIAAATERLEHGLLLTMDRTPGTRQNPDPLSVQDGDYACYEVPDRQTGPGHPQPPHSMTVYLQPQSGGVHLRLKYYPASCPTRLAYYAADVMRLSSETWWGDYVR